MTSLPFQKPLISCPRTQQVTTNKINKMIPFCIENENREKYEAGIKITETAIEKSED